jgi:hypothetical protein
MGFLSRVRTLIEGAVRKGAPAYNRGEHKKCAHIYLATHYDIIQTKSMRGSPFIHRFIYAATEAARDMASKQYTSAAWTLRRAFDQYLNLHDTEEKGRREVCTIMIQIALDSGSPAFNVGNHKHCYSLYMETALVCYALLKPTQPEQADQFMAACKQATVQGASSGSWTMHFLFGRFLDKQMGTNSSHGQLNVAPGPRTASGPALDPGPGVSDNSSSTSHTSLSHGDSKEQKGSTSSITISGASSNSTGDGDDVDNAVDATATVIVTVAGSGSGSGSGSEPGGSDSSTIASDSGTGSSPPTTTMATAHSQSVNASDTLSSIPTNPALGP